MIKRKSNPSIGIYWNKPHTSTCNIDIKWYKQHTGIFTNIGVF